MLSTEYKDGSKRDKKEICENLAWAFLQEYGLPVCVDELESLGKAIRQAVDKWFSESRNVDDS